MKTNNKAFSLIEVLVSAAIIAVGLLGLASMQINALKNSRNAKLYISAVHLAKDMATRIRLNPAEAINGTTSDYVTGTATENTNCTSTSTATNNFCSASQMALHDLYEWETTITANLSNATGVVCIDSTPEDGTAVSPA